MKWLCAAIAVGLPIAGYAQTSSIDIDQARLYFDELRQLGQADGGALWGRQVAGPMLFVDPQSSLIVANMNDARGSLRAEKGVWLGTLSPEQSPANTSIEWNGRRW